LAVLWALFITLSFKRYFSWRKVKIILKICNVCLWRLKSQCNYLCSVAMPIGLMLFTSLIVHSVHAAGNGYGATAQQVATPVRDPFTTSDRMYGEVGNQSAQRAGNGMGFVPGYGAQTAPKMRLKGFVTKGNKKAAALLEVEGAGVYLVSEGDEIGLQALGQNSVLKIIKVDVNGVRVQSGQVNQVIVVR
jgi:hypothetical protein